MLTSDPGLAALVQFGLLLGGWVVAFLLGAQLQTGFALWRARARKEPPA